MGDRDLKAIMAAYNERLARVAREGGVLFTKEVLEPAYGASDFVDNGHFSEAGNKTVCPGSRCSTEAGDRFKGSPGSAITTNVL